MLFSRRANAVVLSKSVLSKSSNIFFRAFSLSPYGTEVPPPVQANPWTRFTQSKFTLV